MGEKILLRWNIGKLFIALCKQRNQYYLKLQNKRFENISLIPIISEDELNLLLEKILGFNPKISLDDLN